MTEPVPKLLALAFKTDLLPSPVTYGTAKPDPTSAVRALFVFSEADVMSTPYAQQLSATNDVYRPMSLGLGYGCISSISDSE